MKDISHSENNDMFNRNNARVNMNSAVHKH